MSTLVNKRSTNREGGVKKFRILVYVDCEPPKTLFPKIKPLLSRLLTLLIFKSQHFPSNMPLFNKKIIHKITFRPTRKITLNYLSLALELKGQQVLIDL